MEIDLSLSAPLCEPLSSFLFFISLFHLSFSSLFFISSFPRATFLILSRAVPPRSWYTGASSHCVACVSRLVCFPNLFNKPALALVVV